MPRNGSGVYSLPASYLATTGETITALQHNAPLLDLEADANAARSIATGGTGASTAAAARAALGLEIGADVQAYNSRIFPMPAGLGPLPYCGSTAPDGWLFCYGQAISRTTYAALFAVLGTTYGVGDGSTTFNLPDLRGRVIAGKDDMGGTSADRLTNQTGGLNGDTLGGSGGSETHTLTEAQMPSHTHTGTTSSNGAHTHTLNRASSNGGGDGMWGNSTVTGTTSTSSNGAHTHTFTTASAGSGAAHNNVQPTIILNYIIKT